MLHIHPKPVLHPCQVGAALSFVDLDINICSPALDGAASLKQRPKAQHFSLLFGPQSHSGMPSHGTSC